MTDRHQQLVLHLAEMRKMVDRATLGPWRAMETKDAWTLHGEARQFHTTKAKPIVAPSMQILKAPKHGTSYAEYWPNSADTVLLQEAVNSFEFWLDWADDVAARHFPVHCTCNDIHFLCAAHRMYSWDECPEILGLLRAVERSHDREE